MKSLILYSHKNGQLGNRLFAFSHLIANAKENDYTIVNLSFDEYAKYFEATSQDVFCRFPEKRTLLKTDRMRSLFFFMNRGIFKLMRLLSLTHGPLHRIVIADLPEYQFQEERFYLLNSRSFQKIIHSGKLVFLFGRFFRDYDSLEKHQSLIRNYFRPKLGIRNNVFAFLNNVRSDHKVVVGVHIRRGDYQQFMDGKYFYDPQEYYVKMRELQANEPEKEFVFVICSNEQVDIKKFNGLLCYNGPGHFVEDMYVFAGCDYIFGPPSTYTRWASFYGRVPLFQLDSMMKQIRLSEFSMLENVLLFNF